MYLYIIVLDYFYIKYSQYNFKILSKQLNYLHITTTVFLRFHLFASKTLFSAQLFVHFYG